MIVVNRIHATIAFSNPMKASMKLALLLYSLAVEGVDLKLGRETLSLAFSGSGMRQAFRWRPAFTKALTASATI